MRTRRKLRLKPNNQTDSNSASKQETYMEKRGKRDSGAQERPHILCRPQAPAQRKAPMLGRGDQVRAQAPPFTGRALELQQDLPTILGGASRGHHRCTPGCWGQGSPLPCSFPARPDTRPSRVRPALGKSAPPTTPHSLNKGLLDRCTCSMNTA